MPNDPILKPTSCIHGRTTLHVAVSKQSLHNVNKLLKKQPSLLEEKDLGGHTALMYAFDREQSVFPICEILMSRGADIYAVNNAGNGLLIMAASENKLELVRKLIDKDATLNAGRLMHEQGQKAMEIALENKCLDMMQFLLESGADPEYFLSLVNSAFIVLDQGISKDARKRSGLEQLMAIISNENTIQAFSLCEYLVNHFPEEIGLAEGVTVLHYASSSLNHNMVKFFLAQGVDPNQIDTKNLTALYCAVIEATKKPGSHQDLVESLLAAKANPNLERTQIVLGEAVSHNLESIVEKLLKYGANPNIPNKDGATPLMIAVFHGRSMKMVRNLVKAGANVSVLTPHTKCSLLHLAVVTENKKMAQATNIEQKLGGYRCSIVEFLLGRPELDVNSVDANGRTPLCWAFELFKEGSTAQKIITMLKEKGADLDQKNNAGHTPRDIAPAKALEYFNSASPVKKENSRKVGSTGFFDPKDVSQNPKTCERSLAHRPNP